MTDEDVIDKVSKMWGRKYQKAKRQKPHHKDSFSLRITGTKAVHWMRMLKPYMSNRRQVQIQKALDAFESRCKEGCRARVSYEMTEKIQILRSKGKSLREIGEELNLHHESVRRRLLKSL